MAISSLVYVGSLIPDRIYEEEVQGYFVELLKDHNPIVGLKCSAGIADIVTDVSVIEVKSVLSRRKLFTACGQVMAYRSSIDLNKKAVIAGIYVPGLDNLHHELRKQGIHIQYLLPGEFLYYRLLRLKEEGQALSKEEREVLNQWKEDFFEGKLCFENIWDRKCIEVLLDRLILGDFPPIDRSIVGRDLETRKANVLVNPSRMLFDAATNREEEHLVHAEGKFKTAVDLYIRLIELGIASRNTLVGSGIERGSKDFELIMFIEDKSFVYLIDNYRSLIVDDIYFLFDDFRARIEIFHSDESILIRMLSDINFKHLVDYEVAQKFYQLFIR